MLVTSERCYVPESVPEHITEVRFLSCVEVLVFFTAKQQKKLNLLTCPIQKFFRMHIFIFEDRFILLKFNQIQHVTE